MGGDFRSNLGADLPGSPKLCVATGPRTIVVKSSTLIPASGPDLASLTAPPETSSSPSR
jgi:hypothetical protein